MLDDVPIGVYACQQYCLAGAIDKCELVTHDMQLYFKERIFDTLPSSCTATLPVVKFDLFRAGRGTIEVRREFRSILRRRLPSVWRVASQLANAVLRVEGVGHGCQHRGI
jgi:hypothetical protein